jgi:hypothetical protein
VLYFYVLARLAAPAEKYSKKWCPMLAYYCQYHQMQWWDFISKVMKVCQNISNKAASISF